MRSFSKRPVAIRGNPEKNEYKHIKYISGPLSRSTCQLLETCLSVGHQAQVRK